MLCIISVTNQIYTKTKCIIHISIKNLKASKTSYLTTTSEVMMWQ